MREKTKNSINKMLLAIGKAVSDKRDELDNLKQEGEDKISIHLNAGELPPEYNDPELNQRYQRLWLIEKKLGDIQQVFTEALGLKDTDDISLESDFKSRLRALELEIINV